MWKNKASSCRFANSKWRERGYEAETKTPIGAHRTKTQPRIGVPLAPHQQWTPAMTIMPPSFDLRCSIRSTKENKTQGNVVSRSGKEIAGLLDANNGVMKGRCKKKKMVVKSWLCSERLEKMHSDPHPPVQAIENCGIKRRKHHPKCGPDRPLDRVFM